MNENIDIFILSHKDFEPSVSDPIYKVMNLATEHTNGSNLLTYSDNTLDNISDMNFTYNEYTGIYWLWKNYQVKDYIGFNHYRRYYSFMDDVPDLNQYFKDGYDIIVNQPLIVNVANVYEQYAGSHNGNDLLQVFGIIKRLYPEYTNSVDFTHKCKKLYPCNMFLMSKSHFNAYCSFLFSVLDEFHIVNHLVTKQDYIDRVNSGGYFKKNYPNNTLDYQIRLDGYLAERIFNVYFNQHFHNPKEFKVILTEEKYKGDSTYERLCLLNKKGSDFPA